MPERKKVVALVCLQAQHVAGLPAAAEGRQILLHLPHQQEAAAAVARCRAGVAAFHDQVLLLHCAPVDRITSVAVTVSFYDCSTIATIDLATQLRSPSPGVLTFVLGGAAAGAVLSLALHHRLIRRRRSACLCLPLPIPNLLLNCLGTNPVVTDHNRYGDDHDDQSSSGFITIEKGAVSQRRPPSDNLLTTDDEGDGGKHRHPMPLAEELEVEDEFLDKLEAHHRSWDLDALIRDAEAELAAIREI